MRTDIWKNWLFSFFSFWPDPIFHGVDFVYSRPADLEYCTDEMVPTHWYTAKTWLSWHRPHAVPYPSVWYLLQVLPGSSVLMGRYRQCNWPSTMDRHGTPEGEETAAAYQYNVRTDRNTPPEGWTLHPLEHWSWPPELYSNTTPVSLFS